MLLQWKRTMTARRKSNILHLPNKRFKHLRILKVVNLLLKKELFFGNIFLLQETEGKGDKMDKENEEVDLDLNTNEQGNKLNEG